MQDVRYERFYTYREMEAFLQEAAESYPSLVSLESLGQTPENREVYVVRVNDSQTGPDGQKPAYYVQGGIHAQEGAGVTVALTVLRTLLTNPESRELLRRVTFYLVPCLNPDGSNYAVEHRAEVRSRLQRVDHANGVVPADVDGDGLILQMRIQDPAGDMTEDPEDPRLMVRRNSDEMDGPFYRLYTEGIVEHYDGGDLVPGVRNIDFNRNWGVGWKTLPQSSAYPNSEPEVRAVCEFLTQHPNIFAGVDLHCGTNAIIRPPEPEGFAISDADRQLVEEIGRTAESLTGFPLMNIGDYGPTWRKPVVLPGNFNGWAYHGLGISCYVVELGNGFNNAGITAAEYFAADATTRERTFMRRVIAYHDANGSVLFRPWRVVEHPQLGTVEVGGLLHGNAYYMHPPVIEGIAPNVVAFVRTHAAMHPHLQLGEPELRQVGPGVYRVRATLANTGGFSTAVMTGGGSDHLRRPVVAELVSGDGQELLSRPARFEVPVLEGRGGRIELEWFVSVPEGAASRDAVVRADHPRAGRSLVAVTFPA
jgi:hypothetical protein